MNYSTVRMRGVYWAPWTAEVLSLTGIHCFAQRVREQNTRSTKGTQNAQKRSQRKSFCCASCVLSCAFCVPFPIRWAEAPEPRRAVIKEWGRSRIYEAKQVGSGHLIKIRVKKRTAEDRIPGESSFALASVPAADHSIDCVDQCV